MLLNVKKINDKKIIYIDMFKNVLLELLYFF